MTRENLLILTKTYPSPSAKYRETSCVAAVNDAGQLRRIYPVPFRLLEGEKQFRKWEWITAATIKSKKDYRPESHKVDYDHIECSGEVIGTQNNWELRMKWLRPHIVSGISALEALRREHGQTLGVLRVSQLNRLVVEKVTPPDWTEAEVTKLSQELLFDSEATKRRAALRKMPRKFYYEYECNGMPHRHRIIDWELGALYWNCVRKYGDAWEEKLREKMEREFAQKDLHFLMGTMQAHPHVWMIVGFYYPPHSASAQGTLFGAA